MAKHETPRRQRGAWRPRGPYPVRRPVLAGGIREVTASAQACLRQRPVPQTDAGYASRVAADAEWR